MVDQPAEQEFQQFLQVFLGVLVNLVETDVLKLVDERLVCAFLGAQTFVLYSLHVFLFVREVFFCIFLQFIQDLYDAVIAGEAVKVLDQLACLVNDAEKLFVLGVDKLDACQILVCKLDRKSVV